MLPAIALTFYSGSQGTSSRQSRNGDPCERYGKRKHNLRDTTICLELLKSLFNDSQNRAIDLVNEKSRCAYDILTDLYPKKNNRFWGFYYLNVGTAYLNLENYNEARNILLLGQEVYEQLGTGYENKLSIIYTNLGITYKESGAYNKAIEYYYKKLDYLIRFEPAQHITTAKLYSNIANVYFLSEDLEQAESLYLKAIEVGGTSYEVRQTAYEGLFHIAVIKENFAQAKELLLKNITDTEKNVQSLNYFDLAHQYNSWAYLMIESKNYAGAVTNARNAINVFIKGKGTDAIDENLGYFYSNLAISSYFDGRFKMFENTLDSSLFHYNYFNHGVDSINNFFGFLNLLYSTTIVYEDYYLKTNDVQYLHKANNINSINLDYTKQIIAGLEIEDQKGINDYRETFINQGLNIKYLLYQETKDPIYIRESFILSEQSKIPGYYELKWIKKNLIKTQNDDNYVLLNALREKALNNKISQHLLTKKDVGIHDSRFISLHAEGQRIEKEINALEKQVLSSKSSGKVYARTSDAGIDIDNLKQFLKSRNQCLIEYKMSDSLLYSFVITPDTLGIFKISIKEKRPDIISFIRQIKDKDMQVNDSLAYDLYKLLISPAVSLIGPYKNLLIIPDKELGYLSFGCLQSKASLNNRKEYLINQYNIQTNFSVKLQMEMVNNQITNDAKKRKLLGVAPQYTIYNSDLKDSTGLRAVLAPLKYNSEEVEEIGSIVNSDILEGKQAKKSTVLGKIKDYPIIHFAMHGIADDKSGDLSYLSFCRNDAQMPVSEYNLYNEELYNSDIPAEMVVLSACETGVGQYVKGEGMISLARGFSFAGAKSIVMTLWRIDDFSSKGILVDFYKFLRKNHKKDEAIRLAQLNYLKKNPDAHPYYWAAFIPIGDMTPIDLSDGIAWWKIILAGGLCLSILLWLYRIKRGKLQNHSNSLTKTL